VASKPVPVRLDESILARLDLLKLALRERVPRGVDIDRSDALRVAIFAGLEAEEARLRARRGSL
jgi:hypothetical protein